MPRIVIDDSNWQQFAGRDIVVDGDRMGRGMTHDYEAEPVGFGAVQDFDIPLIPRDEWRERIAHMKATKTRLSDIRNVGNDGRLIDAYDQNGQGYCWAYSTMAAITMARAVANEPYVRLSGHAVGCKIKSWRDEGGWNPLSVQFAIEHGYPPVSHWPEKSMSRQYDTPETWAEAKKYRITEGFMQLRPAVYDRNLTFDQLMTCLLLRIPCPVDLMWWRHSVCAIDPLDYGGSIHDQNTWGIGILNSWRNSWGENGYGEIRGRKAVPDGATAIKVVTLSA